MQPTEQAARPAAPQKRPPTRRLEPGDLVCGECGEGNPPIRKFCSRCGTSLAEAEVVKRKWWQRFKRKVKVTKAGERPGRGGRTRAGGSKFGEAVKRVFPVVRNTLAVVFLLAGILYSVYPPFRAEVNERWVAGKRAVEKAVLPQYTPVRPTAVTATAELPEHPGLAASDGFTNTFWSAPGDGPPPALVLTFDRPVDVARAIVRIGDVGAFSGHHRPQQLHFVFSNGKTYDVTLKDTPDPQQVKIENGEGSTSVEVHVQSQFRSLSGVDVAITELELFERVD